MLVYVLNSRLVTVIKWDFQAFLPASASSAVLLTLEISAGTSRNYPPATTSAIRWTLPWRRPSQPSLAAPLPPRSRTRWIKMRSAQRSVDGSGRRPAVFPVSGARPRCVQLGRGGSGGGGADGVLDVQCDKQDPCEACTSEFLRSLNVDTMLMCSLLQNETRATSAVSRPPLFPPDLTDLVRSLGRARNPRSCSRRGRRIWSSEASDEDGAVL